MKTDFAQTFAARRGRHRALSGALAMALLVVAGCKRSGAAQTAGGMPPAVVITSAVVTRDVPVYLDEIGRCSAYEVVSIKPQVSGEITKVAFEEGKDVKAGQLLVTIDRRPYEAALA